MIFQITLAVNVCVEWLEEDKNGHRENSQEATVVGQTRQRGSLDQSDS